jgi:hypothetical protein
VGVGENRDGGNDRVLIQAVVILLVYIDIFLLRVCPIMAARRSLLPSILSDLVENSPACHAVGFQLSGFRHIFTPCFPLTDDYATLTEAPDRSCWVSVGRPVVEIFLGRGNAYLRLVSSVGTLCYSFQLEEIVHMCVWSTATDSVLSIIVEGLARALVTSVSTEHFRFRERMWYNDDVAGDYELPAQWNRFDLHFLRSDDLRR